ncbi:putative phosphatase YkrA [Collibacillus ludicampi]|uniref:Phosphatase YkrA n=1 Tax=Collibacillus ludicampi TaxID=2771369 RepID=A0AAV4LB54_9BACL|nr:Cof-type HAD-IIB family hydrolase [Collibacillus ludicampi]GIM44906.1 putative phosphatase YkrA [Collibacillus ludicampi]
MMYRIAFFDVDGTIYDGKTVSPKTKEAIQALKGKGIIPVICTGRAKPEAEWLLKMLGISYGVFNNGALVCHENKVIDKSPIPRVYVQKLLDRATRYDTTMMVCSIDNCYTNRPNCPTLVRIRKELGLSVPLPLTESLPECFQVIIFCQEHEESRFQLEEVEFSYHRWNPDAYDLNLRGMNKAVGVEKLLRHLGIPKEHALAFGDGLNDYAMLEYVGCGVKMGNGHPDLNHVADLTTKNIEEEGVYHALSHLLKVI